MKTLTTRGGAVCACGALLWAFAAVAGCAGNNDLVPETAPSSSSVGYSEEWPERLKTIRERYREGEKLARMDTKTFATFPDEYGEPDWAVVTDAMRLADEAGRSQAVADHIRRSREVKGFLEEHERDLARRVTGHVNAQLKKAAGSCEYQGGPGTGRVIRDAAERELEERYLKLSEPHRLLEANEDALNKQDTQVAEDQIDTVTATSHFVWVDAVLLRNEIDRMLEEAETVQETLDTAISAEREVAANPDASKNQVKSAREREEALKQLRGDIDGVLHNARTERDGMDEDITALRDDYRTAFDALIESLEQRQEAAPANPEEGSE